MSDPIDWGTRNYSLSSAPVPVPPTVGYPSPVGTPNPRVLKRRTGLIVALAVIGALVLAGGAGTGVWFVARHGVPAVVPSTFDVHGTLVIQDDCTSLGYSDIGTGTQVTVTDESGTVLGIGDLGQQGQCRWSFLVLNVPAGHRFYGVGIGRRGTIQYTEAQLRAGVSLSLG